jgi:hypothetical protein
MTRARFQHAKPRRRVRPLAIALALLVAASVIVSRVGLPSTSDEDRGGSRSITIVPGESEPPAALDPVAVDVAWPNDLTWVTIAGLDLPVSGTAGPADLTGGRARGFAHSPAGAVFAALHLLVRTSPQVGPQVWAPTLREQVAGPDLAAYTEAVRLGYQAGRDRLQVPDGRPLGRIYASIQGVRIDGYAEQAASLRVLIEAPGADGNPARAATMVQVSWSGSDWQLIAPPQGDWATMRVLVSPTATAGYTPLPGR